MTRPDAEEERIGAAQAAMPAVANRYDDILTAPDAPLRLWEAAVADARNGIFDDRPLYWARLKLLRALPDGQRPAAERVSRGMDLEWPSDGPAALVTGFDPFHLHRDIAQSNPAGLAALALHGTTIAGVHVRAAVLPVRFVDFDQGLVEDLLTPVLRRRPRLVLTISMGRGEFDVERFPGRRRSSQSADNRSVRCGATAGDPLPSPGLAGPEFLETTLPVAAMAAVQGRWRVRDNRRVTTLHSGELDAASLADLAGETSVEGSGGGFLSNEIAYRSLWLRSALGVDAPVGHLHVPAVRGYDEAVETAVVEQVRRIVEAALQCSPGHGPLKTDCESG